MKHTYITPVSEMLEMLLDYSLLEGSLIDEYYGGDNVDPIDGQW